MKLKKLNFPWALFMEYSNFSLIFCELVNALMAIYSL